MRYFYLLLISVTLLTGCTTPSGPPLGHVTPANYVGPEGLRDRLHLELCGSYFDESVGSRMQVSLEVGPVYRFEYQPELRGDALLYHFYVWIAEPSRDYRRAVEDIMATIQGSGIPQEDWGTLKPGLFYDRRHDR